MGNGCFLLCGGLWGKCSKNGQNVLGQCNLVSTTPGVLKIWGVYRPFFGTPLGGSGGAFLAGDCVIAREVRVYEEKFFIACSCSREFHFHVFYF